MRKIDLSKYRKAQNVRIIDDDEENIMPIDYSKYKKANLSQEAVDIINDYDQHNNKNKIKTTVNVVNNKPNEDGYTDTGKKLGDYDYYDYKTKGQYKIYSKDGNYYYYDEKNKSYNTVNEQHMTTKEEDRKQYEEAVKLGFKGNKRKLSLNDQLKLDTSNLTKDEYKEYEKDLERQENKRAKDSEIRYGGPGLKGSLGEIKQGIKNIGENLIDPIARTPENIKIGQLNEKLGREAYKKMEGKKNNYDEVKRQVDNYTKFNQDIVTSENLIDQNTQNMPNQISAFLSGVKGGGIGGVVGGLAGATIGTVATGNPSGTATGAVQGAKLLGGAGYVGGQAKYTYELESGYQYQALLDLGVPEDIAKEEARKVGTTNALIESGESLLDLVTLGKASQVRQMLTDGLVKKYGLETVKDWTKGAATSYVTNVASEGIEEGLQEYSSIQGEKRATKKAGIERDDSQDFERIKDSTIAGSFGALLSGAVTRPTGVFTNRYVNSKIGGSANNNIQNSSLTERSIQNTANALNLGNLNTNNLSVVNNSTDGKTTTNNFVESARTYNIDISNNTIKNIDKTLSNRGIVSRFDASEFTNNNENAFWKVNSDGTREVVFNPKAKTNDLLENVAVHELYHDISKSEDGQKIKDELLDFAKTKEGYEEARKSLEQLYSNKYDPNSDQFKTLVDEEAVASILGKKLGNQEFVNSLTVEKPSVAKSVYNWVVDKLNKLNKLTGYKSEKLFWKDVKSKFDSAYRSNVDFDVDSRFMITGYKAAKQLDRNFKTKEFSENYKEAIKMEKHGALKDKIRKETGWYKDVNGDWKFEISDKSSELKISPKAFTDYKLKELLDHNILYKAYPFLKNTNVKFSKLPETTRGKTDKLTGNIYINNNLIGNDSQIERTLLHEIQHKVQRKEKFQGGTTQYRENSYERYRNNFGETEARETSQRKKLNFEERLATPSYTQTYNKQSKKKLYTKEDTKWYNYLKGDRDVEENLESSKKTIRLHQMGGIEELDNSSFSFDKNKTRSLSNTDNQGRKLSKGQQEFFKDSKVRDNNGNLITYYNGSDNFNVYDKNKLSNNSKWGKGIYLTKYKDIASMYGNNIKELYVNIKNPISSTKKTISFDEYNELYKKINDGESGYIEEYSMYDNDLDLLWDMTNSGNWADYAKEIREITGKDGLIINDDNKAEDMVIAFESNQLKSVDNLNPTNTEDIRYSQNSNKWQGFVDQNFQTEGTGHTLSQLKTNKVLNPTEIANLTREDAGTTPNLPDVKVPKGNKKSKFTKNISEKTKMLTEENRKKLSQEKDVAFYKGITNKQSLEEAYDRLNDGGSGETLNWISRNSYDKDGKLKKKPTATDVAEGWILLKQYQDAGDYDSMVQVAKVMRQMGTESGQAIQAYNIMSRLTPEGMVKYAQSELDEAYDHMVKNKTKKWIEKNRDKFTLTPDETAYIVNNIKEASELPDGYEKKVKLAQIQSLISNKLPPVRGAGIKAWMRISMLFNLKTQIRNIMGNAVITPVNAISDTFSALMDKQIAKKTGVRTTGAPNVKNFAKGFKKGLYESWNDFKLDINTRDMQGNRFEIGEGKSFTDQTKVGKALNKTDKILSFMLDAGDRPFYEGTFINSINNQKILNNTDTVTQDMIDIATTEALQRTWQDNNAYTKFVLNTRRGLNFGMKYGLGDALIPFAKTPANLTKALIDYSPAGLVTTLIEGKKLKNAIETNQFTPQMQHKFVQNLGKATAGSLLYILGYILAREGITTGANDEDKDVSDFMRNTLGIQPYSIKIGNKTFTYDWAQPVATPFAMMADLQKNDEEAGILNKILSTADVGANLLLQQSFMESIENVFSDYQSIPNGIIQQVLDLPSRAVPTLVKQVNDMIDTTQRTSLEKSDNLKTAKNKVKSKIPVLSTGLAPSRDSLGRVIKKYGGDANLFNVFLNPANTNKGKVSDSAKEIYKIYQKTGDKTIMPRVAPYSIVSGGKSKTLDSKERSEFQRISGQIVEKNIKELAKTDEYRKMDDSYKTEAIKSIVDYAYNYAKAKSLKQPISKNYKKAYEYTKNGGALYDFYADKIYKKSKEK